MTTSLATLPSSEALGVVLRGAAGISASEPLRAPASGLPCVHWRLRIVQTMGPGVELVHDVTAPEPFELQIRDDAGPSRRVKISADARLDALPVLHRDGSPGALAVARLFGLEGRVHVEEVAVRPGEALEVEGVLLPESSDELPFRGVELPTEIAEAVVRLPDRGRRPNLLPWALGTAAALASSVGLLTTVAHTSGGRALSRFAASAVTPVGRAVLRAVAGPPAPSEIGPLRPSRPRWP